MKQQGSLFTTLLVILESTAVVGFLFLIFAVSSISSVGQHKNDIQFKANPNKIQSLARSRLDQKVIWAIDQEKQHSLHTDAAGMVHIRTILPLNHNQTSQSLVQQIYTLQVSDRKNQPIAGAVVTILSDSLQKDRIDEKGETVHGAINRASKVILAAPGYITQTVTLPLRTDEKNPIHVHYRLKINPMSQISRSERLAVIDKNGRT